MPVTSSHVLARTALCWIAAAMVGLWPWCGIAAEPADGDAGRKTKPLSAEQRKILERFASEFVEITPGQGRFPKSFDMGSKAGPSSERPAHEVTFERPFAIAKYEVTQELYQAVMGKNPSVWQGPGRERNSCEMMTWQEANAFCRQVTTLMREADLLKDGELLRLPTEAEWEYCCRAGTDTDYSFGHEARGPGDAGDKASLLDAYAWHTGNAAGNDPSVGVLKPNAWGLYDMHGYLWEYVLDAWHDNYDEAPSDGSAAGADMKHVRRVIRGGSWRDRWSVLRSRTRWAIPDHVRSDAIGFRCVKSR